MLKMYIILTVVLILPVVFSCPSQESLYPCVCSVIGLNSQISCSGLENEQVLSDVVYGLKTMKKFYSFTIRNGNFRFIPHDIFKDIKFQELQILSSSIMALTDTDIAFEGLEEDLVSLVITDSNVLNAWDWSVLRNLKKLVKLHIDVDMNAISEDIELISSLKMMDISFDNNEITYIYDKAFSAFKDLLSISLKKNLIAEVKRSMMPNPAVMLWKLDFSHNEIQQLPSDLFENMPSLESLNLDSNKLLTLNEKTFNKIWAKLRYFNAIDNPLRCDCRLSWITELKFPDNINAVCEQPKHLAGKSLKEMKESDLWC